MADVIWLTGYGRAVCEKSRYCWTAGVEMSRPARACENGSSTILQNGRNSSLGIAPILDACPENWKKLLDVARKEKLTLLFGAHDTKHNNAIVLKEYLEEWLKSGGK